MTALPQHDAFESTTVLTSSIVLVSASKTSHGHTMFRETRKQYARVHGYTYFHCFGDQLERIARVLSVLDGHHIKSFCMILAFVRNPEVDWLLWTDDDAAINPVYRSTPLSLFVGTVPSKEFSWVMGNSLDTNTGVFFVRRNCLGWKLLHQWLDVSMQQTFTWDDQHSFRSIIADKLREQNQAVGDREIKYDSCSEKEGWDPQVCDDTFLTMIEPVLANSGAYGVHQKKLDLIQEGLDKIPSNLTKPFYFLPRTLRPQLALIYGAIRSTSRPTTLFFHPAGSREVGLARLSHLHRPLMESS